CLPDAARSSRCGAPVCGGHPANYCDGACTDVATDLANCGACGNACTTTVVGATATCGHGVCGFACPAGQTDCSGTCVNTQADAGNCGTCGTRCAFSHAVGGACEAGVCSLGSCAAGYGNCDGQAADGCETDLTGVANCGSCGTVCPGDACTPAQCSGGACNRTSSCTGSQTCGGGGVADQCGSCTPATTCPGGQNCGTAPDGCGSTVSCGTCTAPANATATCTSGTCGFTCSAGFQPNTAGDGCDAIPPPANTCPAGGVDFCVVGGSNAAGCNGNRGCFCFISASTRGPICIDINGPASCGTPCLSDETCPSGEICILDMGSGCTCADGQGFCGTPCAAQAAGASIHSAAITAPGGSFPSQP
ncbi:MAG: hypothetical protein ACR2OO_10435, partial [Thermomicrobiales bacterium]